MQRSTIAYLVLGATLGAAFPVGAATAPRSEAELLAEVHRFYLSKKAACARGDAKAHAAHFAPDGLQVENTDHLWTREEIWDDNCVHNHYGLSLRPFDLHARAYGDTIVVTNLADEIIDRDGAPVVRRRLRFLDTFVRRHGRLIEVAEAEMVVPIIADPVAVHVDPALLDDYVGVYQLAPEHFLTVTRVGDKLYGEGTGDAGPSEFLAENETTFFFKGAPWRQTFVRDSNGHVTHAVFRQDGNDMDLPKIK